jgi:hypothetical protein
MGKELFDFSKVEQWYNDGLTVTQIAERVGCKWRAIYNAMDRYGIKRRDRTTTWGNKVIAKYEPYKEQITNLFKEGNSTRTIANITNINFRTIAFLLNHYGCPRKRSGGSYKGDKSTNWNGGIKTMQGYIRILSPNHPYVATDGYVPQHRLVMEQSLGRYLLPTEIVHHKDGNKSNNDISNLELISPANHRLVTELCNQCPLKKEIKRLERQLKEAQTTCRIILDSSHGKLYQEAT